MEEAIGKIKKNTVRWYAVYTAPRVEERIIKKLEQLGFECYCPLRSVVRVWANRKRNVLTPTVPGIIFVSLSEADTLKVTALKVASFLLNKEGGYISVSSEELEQIYIDGLESLLLQK